MRVPSCSHVVMTLGQVLHVKPRKALVQRVSRCIQQQALVRRGSPPDQRKALVQRVPRYTQQQALVRRRSPLDERNALGQRVPRCTQEQALVRRRSPQRERATVQGQVRVKIVSDSRSLHRLDRAADPSLDERCVGAEVSPDAEGVPCFPPPPRWRTRTRTKAS